MEKNAPKSRSKLFIENFLVYGVGGTLSRLIPFVMLPILTRLYPSSSYIGINDSVNLIVTFASQIAIMGVYDAMYRYYFEQESVEYHRKITSSALILLLGSGLIVALLICIFHNSLERLAFGQKTHTGLIYIVSATTYLTTLNTIIAAPTRMRNQRVRFLAVNFITSAFSYAITIVMVYKGFYITAMPLAAMLAVFLSTVVFWYFNRGEFAFKSANGHSMKMLLKLGLPCVPSFTFYWILSSAQLVFITNMIGIEATGIYAVGAKLASISQLIYSAFAAGWQYFAFSTMKDKDHIQLISRIFDYLAGISFFATCTVTLFAKPIFGLLFPVTYEEGAWVMPMLFLAPLVQMLYQTLGAQFWVVKETTKGAFCLLIGTACAIITDVLLIPVVGIRGAAVAGLFGFTVALTIMVILLLRRRLIVLSKRALVAMLLCYATVILFTSKSNIFVYAGCAVFSLLAIILMYWRDAVLLLRGLFRAT
ncbi:MAG: oligosaccharide flippase family protein [Clostridiaceae bacterium]